MTIDRQGAFALEEKYIRVPRQSGGRRQAPPSRREPARRREPEDYNEDYPVRRKPAKARRSVGISVALGCYKALVIVSALIVGAYIAFQLISSREPTVNPDPPVPAVDPVGSGGDVSTTDPEDVRQRRDRVFNILLAATDWGGTRTDVMMVMSYDVAQQKVGVVSVPRDTITRREAGKHPKLAYGSGGVKQRMEDISNMLGIPLDYYIKVDLKGFIALVDYLDGFDFYIPCDMDYDDLTPGEELHIHFKEGWTHLNGQQAMEVARFRKNNRDENGNSVGYSDVGRTQTQQKMLVALSKKVLSWGSLTKITGFIDIFNQYVDTDLSLTDMAYFAKAALELDLDTGVETTTLEGRGDARYGTATWCFELDPESTLETVNRLINPYDRDLTLEDMDLLKGQSYIY